MLSRGSPGQEKGTLKKPDSCLLIWEVRMKPDVAHIFNAGPWVELMRSNVAFPPSTLHWYISVCAISFPDTAMGTSISNGPSDGASTDREYSISYHFVS